MTGKRPAVVIYDTDGREGRFEYRIRIACRKAGVRYEVFRKQLIRSDPILPVTLPEKSVNRYPSVIDFDT